MEPIDISSDSDLDIDLEEFGITQESPLANATVHPKPTVSSNTGYGTRDVSVDDIRMRNSSFLNTENGSLPWNTSQPSSSGNIVPTDQLNSDVSSSHKPLRHGNLSHSHGVNANVYGTNYDAFVSQPASKRLLPTSVQHNTYKFRSDFADDSRNHQALVLPKSIQFSTGPNFSNSMSYNDHKSDKNDDDLLMYESNGNRMLPVSLTHGTTMLSSCSMLSDPQLRTIGSDERAPGNNERLIFRAALEDLYQPNNEADVPSGLLSVSLLKHQRIALQWMLQRETKSLHCLGGILADDQGLGKTISMISLILTQKFFEANSKSEQKSCEKPEPLNLDDDDKITTILDNDEKNGESTDGKPFPQVSLSARTLTGRRPAAGTLVVCPASVLRQWARELDEKVAHGSKLNVLIYHGGSRTKDPVELAKFDVVLTTYAIVTNEVPKRLLLDEDDAEGLGSEFSNFKKQKKIKNGTKKRKKGKKDLESHDMDSISGALAKVVWSRVVLDEAQTIKNHRTQVAKACCSLRAKKRWCLSGTPIQNTIDDLYSYFRFLRYEPYNVYKQFYTSIKVPIYKNSMNGYKKLQVVLKSVLLRRTKETKINGVPIITLPPKSIFLRKVNFSEDERAFYTWLEAESRNKFKAFAAAGTVKQNYANILLMLLRLRQACDHPILVKGSISESAGKLCTDVIQSLPSDVVANLLNYLAASSAICLVCNDPPEDAVVTMCGHVFCYQCVSDYLIGDENTCPASGCKEHVSSNNVFSEETLRNYGGAVNNSSDFRRQYDEGSMVCQRDFNSSKVNAILEILHGTTNANDVTVKGSAKSIIFSQWTGMLDIVEYSLCNHGITYRRLDGTMTLTARDKAVKDFNVDPEVTVMLMSLKAGNLGLNMVAASHVVLLDLWWNPTTEDQAIDRAHRIGQTRAVTVTRLTVKDTVEDRILSLQDEKRKMVASAFGEDQSGTSASSLTLEDLKYLFNVDF